MRSRAPFIESSAEPAFRVENAKQPYKLFLTQAEKLVSDGTVVDKGTLKLTTKSGATQTSDNELAALHDVEERKKQVLVQKENAIRARKNRKEKQRINNAEAERRRSFEEEEAL